jgi:hypothetical protein
MRASTGSVVISMADEVTIPTVWIAGIRVVNDRGPDKNSASVQFESRHAYAASSIDDAR